MSEENKDTPNVLEQIEAIKGTDEFQTLLKNSNENYWKGKIGGEVSNLHGLYDSVLEETLGIKKDPNKKSTEQLKEVLGSLSNELKTLKDKQGKGTEAEQNKNSEELELLKGKLEHLEKTVSEKEEALSDLKAKNLQGKVNSSLDAALAGKTYKPSYSDEDLKELISLRKSRLLKRSKVIQNDDGTNSIVYYKDAEKTKPYLNTIGDPMTSKEVANIEFSSLFFQQKKGGNTSPDSKGEAQGDAISLDMSKVTTKEKFFLAIDQALQAKGIAKTHEDYKKIKNATYAAYEVGKMPMS